MSEERAEVWTELPPEYSRVMVTAWRSPQGDFAATFATEDVKSRTELIEILEGALQLAKLLKPGSGPNKT